MLWGLGDVLGGLIGCIVWHPLLHDQSSCRHGRLLHSVDMSILMALSTIASKQKKGTEKTLEKCAQLLDYLASNSDAMVCYYASDMVMNIYSNALYLL